MLIPGSLIMLFTYKIQSIVKSSFYCVNSEKNEDIEQLIQTLVKVLYERVKNEPGLSLFQSCITFAQKNT